MLLPDIEENRQWRAGRTAEGLVAEDQAVVDGVERRTQQGCREGAQGTAEEVAQHVLHDARGLLFGVRLATCR